MRLACTFHTSGPVVQIPLESLLITLTPHLLNHQPHPFLAAQWRSTQASLSSSGVLNIIPLQMKSGSDASLIASLASPLYPVTVSWYLPTSSLMENVEYSAEYHRPEMYWIYSIVTNIRYWRMQFIFQFSKTTGFRIDKSL